MKHATLILLALILVLAAGCKASKFVGTWTPEENQRNVVTKTLEIKKDGSWRIMTIYNERFTGTYKIVDGKLRMFDEKATSYTEEATLESGDRLKVNAAGKGFVYFKRNS